ncbi:hypothetical protein, partial [Paenibacillus nuruki]|uniref:hypothetical protein n=1 Tax=Paenibacillus nuruki TaxID=1886670 RepID=UPI000A566156
VTGQELSVGDRVATGVGTLVSFVSGGKVVGKTATKGVIDGGSWLIGKFSKQVRLARPSDLFKNDFAKNGQRISPKNLYRELKKSEIGLETLDIIRNNSIRIDLDYSKQNGLYGLAIEDYRSIIYVQNTQSKKKTAQIIIHEVTHNMLNTSVYTQREEVIAHIREAKHLNPSLSIGEIRRIIKNVENLYPELPYQ